jgi:hypothetical protein
LRKVQRATSQRIDANLANQRSRHSNEVVIRAACRSHERLRTRSWPRVLRQHVQREPPERRFFKGRHPPTRPISMKERSLIVGMQFVEAFQVPCRYPARISASSCSGGSRTVGTSSMAERSDVRPGCQRSCGLER